MGTITTPDAVPGELIQASWGDSVRADLNMLNTTKPDNADAVLKVGGVGSAMTGPLQVGASDGVAGAGASIYTTGRINALQNTADQPNLWFDRVVSGAAATGQKYVFFQRAGLNIGSISIASTTSVGFNTTSDPRTKTPPPLTRGIGDAADRVRQLGGLAWVGQHIDPATGQPDGEIWDLLSSHDIEDVAPYAVTGERDAVDADGAPIYQQVDFSSMVPLLVAALSQALDRIAALEATP